ncbi:MAG: phosphoribosylanthranilate isomerase [Candidatus Caldatribacteriaceae bacterium]
MLAVKVCGLREEEDVLYLAQLGVWALGFILVEKSPRRVSPENARNLVEKTRGKVLTVGVFQDMDWREVLHLVSFCGFDLVQLHGQETPSFCARFPGKVIKAFGVDEGFDAHLVDAYRGVVRYFLFDTVKGNQRGGTGEPFPWEKLRGLAKELPVIVAGGLGEENLPALLSCIRPFGVDLNSRVEERPGKKDLAKIQRIVTQLRGR